MDDRTRRSREPAAGRSERDARSSRSDRDIRRDAAHAHEGSKLTRAQTGGILREIDEQKYRLD